MTRLLDRLEFVDHGLTVSYCASVEPQDLEITLEFTGENADIMPKMRLLNLSRVIEYGFAGSDVFAPHEGTAEILDMPPYPYPPADHVTLKARVGGVAPITLRQFIETLRLTVPQTGDLRIRSMTIRGSRPLDGGPLSVSTEGVRGWLADPAAAPRPWPKVPFELVDHGEGTDAIWRVVLLEELTPEMRTDLEQRGLAWPVQWRLDGAGQPAFPATQSRVPQCFAAKREFTARFRKFPLTADVMRGLATNTLIHFHHKVAPIERVELTI